MACSCPCASGSCVSARAIFAARHRSSSDRARCQRSSGPWLAGLSCGVDVVCGAVHFVNLVTGYGAATLGTVSEPSLDKLAMVAPAME